MRCCICRWSCCLHCCCCLRRACTASHDLPCRRTREFREMRRCVAHSSCATLLLSAAVGAAVSPSPCPVGPCWDPALLLMLVAWRFRARLLSLSRTASRLLSTTTKPCLAASLPALFATTPSRVPWPPSSDALIVMLPTTTFTPRCCDGRSERRRAAGCAVRTHSLERALRCPRAVSLESVLFLCRSHVEGPRMADARLWVLCELPSMLHASLYADPHAKRILYMLLSCIETRGSSRRRAAAGRVLLFYTPRPRAATIYTHWWW